MNKFSDGFSDNDYEELLNEYAGESLGSKSSERNRADTNTPPVDISVKREPIKREPPKSEERVNGTVKRFAGRDNSAPKKSSLDLDKIKSFEETEAQKNSLKKNSGTMEFNKKSVAKGAQAPVIDKKFFDVKSSLSRFKSLKPKKQANPDNEISYGEAPKDGKKKIDFKALKASVILAFKENKKSFIVFGYCFLIAGILAGVALSCINDILAINRDDDKPVEVVLPNNANTEVAVDTLHDAGLIKNKLFCTAFIKVMESMEKKPKDYLPGVYYFNETMGVEKMISRFKTSSTRGTVISVTIPEGYTIDQIFARLEKNGICTADALFKTVDEVDFSSEYSFIKDIGDGKNRYHMLEGYLFPATYEFQQGADPASVIRTFLNEFNRRWTEDFAKRAAELSLTTDDVIRIASIIEKEAYGEDQFALVSSIIHNRLNRSGLYPTLECNSTLDYVTNTVAKRLPKAKADAYVPYYNTYECQGLPPSAICNPGIEAIKSALNPDTTQYYFFAHDKKMHIYVAKTYEEHTSNLAKIARLNKQDD